MNFVKKNLLPLICGVVILVFIGAIFWPIGSWQAQLQNDMADRAKVIQQAQGGVGKITIPGGESFDRATYEQRIIDAGVKAVQQMDDASKKLVTAAADQNRAGRVMTVQEYHTKFPGNTINNGATEVQILGYEPQANYLPVMTSGVLANPQKFKNLYQQLFPKWNVMLVGTEKVAGLPPTQTDLQAQFDAQEKARVQPVQGNGMYQGGTAAGGASDPAKRIEYERGQIAARAASIKMYVDTTALQHQPWFGGAAAPDESKMFYALVDCWFMKDVVAAITDVNKGSHNVGESPIKRREAVRVGVGPGGAQGGSSSGLFLNMGAGAAPPAATPGGDFTKTMTGRVDNNDYDVCLMEIIVDVDPAYENKFLDALYRTNNGYTVLNIKTDTVDPFDATGNGYLYGGTQVVHLDILVEGLLYRSWTVPIMPDPIRASLGIPLLPPPGTPAPAAPAAQ
jgi:hypothetical protein